MSIHFLKTIGQLWEGKISPDSRQWVGAEFCGYVIQDEYKGKIKNKLGEIRPIGENLSPVQAALKAQGKSPDDVPY